MKKQQIRLLSGFAASAILSACAIIFSSPLEIISWQYSCDEVSVDFNRRPNLTLTEEAFSLSRDGSQPAGRLCWNGNRLTFTSDYPLYSKTEYLLKVSTEAEDVKGNSLTEDFIATFRIEPEGVRPLITEISPADESCIDEQFKELKITFNEKIDFDSILESFSIEPPLRGMRSLDFSGKIFTFSPVEPYEWQKQYKISVSAGLKSSDGGIMAEDFCSTFTAGGDDQPPSIISAASSVSGTLLTPSPPSADVIQWNSWGCADDINIAFSEEVDQETAAHAVSIEPYLPLTIDFKENGSPADMIISFDENLQWMEMYKLTISTAIRDLINNRIEKDTIYYLFIDGASSRPPVIDRVELIQDETTAVIVYDGEDPDSAAASDLLLDTSGGDAVKNPFYVDYYICLAAGAELPFFEFVENFSIMPDQNCIALTYLNFELYQPGESTASADEPAPVPEEEQAVVRIISSVSDSSSSSGDILFQVFELSDSLGNVMEEVWTLEFFDEDN